MTGDLPPTMRPLPAFEGRSVMQMFKGAAAGDADDQLRMAELTLANLSTSKVGSDTLLQMAAMWAKMAVVQGLPAARRTLVNVLLLDAGSTIEQQPHRAREVLAEAISFMDELAGDDDAEAAGKLDVLLSRVDDVGEIVAAAKTLSQWRAEHGALA